MNVTSSVVLCAYLLLAPEPADFRFVQVAPAGKEAEAPKRRPDVKRAVILIHGLRPHPFSNAEAAKPDLSWWEKPDSAMVKTLAADSDVYALGYAQTRPVDEIASSAGLRKPVDSLRAAGYAEVVLVGHSAGGLIARYYVENQPLGGGVTKVIQICSPNVGSSWAKLTSGVRQSQEAFLTSLTKEGRRTAQSDRGEKSIPANVEMACVVSNYFGSGDGMVRSDSQWPADLQKQGVPAVVANALHPTAPLSKSVAKVVGDLVRGPLPRWSDDEVKAVRAKIIGKEK